MDTDEERKLDEAYERLDKAQYNKMMEDRKFVLDAISTYNYDRNPEYIMNIANVNGHEVWIYARRLCTWEDENFMHVLNRLYEKKLVTDYKIGVQQGDYIHIKMRINTHEELMICENCYRVVDYVHSDGLDYCKECWNEYELNNPHE